MDSHFPSDTYYSRLADSDTEEHGLNQAEITHILNKRRQLIFLGLFAHKGHTGITLPCKKRITKYLKAKMAAHKTHRKYVLSSSGEREKT